jgi:hypothetical protein
VKVIIAGSRDFVDGRLLSDTLAGFDGEITEVFSGTAYGADQLGENWANDYGIPVHRFPPQWHLHGRAAGPLRNQQMVDLADALVAFKTHDDSRGTNDVVDRARKKGIPTIVVVTGGK